MSTSRRIILRALAAAAMPSKAWDRRKPRIVLRSSWQTVNIGDIGHSPGVLALLERYIPEAGIVLWPSDIRNGVEQMLRRRFPRLTISTDPDVVFQCDFLLHGSGPYLTGHKDVAEWRIRTKRPYGVYGITMAAAGDRALKIMRNNGLNAYTKDLLDGASFVFLRDSVSLQVVRNGGVKVPSSSLGRMEHSPRMCATTKRRKPSSQSTAWRRAASSAACRIFGMRPIGV